MKQLFILIIGTLPIFTFGQNQELPNNEFDNWDSFTLPTDWATFETAFGSGNGIIERDSIDTENGPYSLKAVTPAPGLIPYSLVTLKDLYYDFQNHYIVTRGISYQSRPDSIWVLYKYEVPNNGPDTSGFALTMLKLDAINNSPIAVMDVVLPLYQTNQWTLQSHALTNHYTSSENPDSLYFSLISSVTQPRTEGATLLVDGIYFNNPAIALNLIDLETNPSEINIYPNPNTDRRVFFKSDDNSFTNCKLRIYNTQGQLVADKTISIGKDEKHIQLDELNNGSYFYNIIDDENQIISKGILQLR